MWRGFRKSAASETEKVRGGGGPLDNLVVLLTSLVLLAIIGSAASLHIHAAFKVASIDSGS
jgi:hypothetical protein